VSHWAPDDTSSTLVTINERVLSSDILTARCRQHWEELVMGTVSRMPFLPTVGQRSEEHLLGLLLAELQLSGSGGLSDYRSLTLFIE
jgi:hypothetical protein